MPFQGILFYTLTDDLPFVGINIMILFPLLKEVFLFGIMHLQYFEYRL